MAFPTPSEFIATLSMKTQIENTWIDESVNKIFESPDYFIGDGQIPFFAEEVDIGIDTSGSTGNQFSGGRGSRGGGIDLYVSKSGTDPIIAAEIKGVIYYLLEMTKVYNLEGVILRIFTFSDTLDRIGVCKLTNNQSLDPIIRNLSKMLIYQFSSTNLLSYLKEVIEKVTDKPVHMVLATDGQPNSGGNIDDVLAYIKSISDNAYEQLSMAIIGAGSIQSSVGGGRGIICRGSREPVSAPPPSQLSAPPPISVSIPIESGTRHMSSGSFQLEDESTTCDIKAIQLMLFGKNAVSYISGSECNIRFLLDMMDLVKNSAYLPSFGDYSKLRETASKYLLTFNQPEAEDILNYRVLLDDGKQLDLPPLVNQTLKSNKWVIGFCAPARSWYLYSRKWQAAIEMVDQSLVDINSVYIVTNTDLDLEHLDDFYIARLQRTVGPFSVDELEKNKLEFKMSVDYNGYWRCRQLIKS